MIEYRCFRNTDPPLIADLWRCQTPVRGIVPNVTPNFLSQHVFGKPYFDRDGLILAFVDGQLQGFVHAGFGPSSANNTICHETGVVSMLMTRPGPDQPDIATGLLDACERYLQQRGAESILAIGDARACPFYLGLYGGARLPGVLTGDAISMAAFVAAEYKEVDRTLIMQRTLQEGAIPIDRSQRELRRSYDIDAAINPPETNWWQAITLGNFARMQFDLLQRETDAICGQLLVWDMQPLANSWQITAAGIVDMDIEPEHLSVETVRFFVAEVSRYLNRRSVSLLEAHHSSHDQRAREIFPGLGFEQVDEAVVLRKTLNL